MVVRRSLELAGADPNQMGVRLRMAGGAVRPQFVAEPLEGDEIVEEGGVRVFIARSIIDEHGEVEIDVTTEHESLMIRPVRSTS